MCLFVSLCTTVITIRIVIATYNVDLIVKTINTTTNIVTVGFTFPIIIITFKTVLLLHYVYYQRWCFIGHRSPRADVGRDDGRPHELSHVNLQQQFDHFHHRHLEDLPSKVVGGRASRRWPVRNVIKKCHYSSPTYVFIFVIDQWIKKNHRAERIFFFRRIFTVGMIIVSLFWVKTAKKFHQFSPSHNFQWSDTVWGINFFLHYFSRFPLWKRRKGRSYRTTFSPLPVTWPHPSPAYTFWASRRSVPMKR